MFIERLISLLRERDLTNAQFLSALGLGKNQINYWKKNRNVPNEVTVKAIADYFNVSVDYLLGNTDQKEKPLVNGDEELNEYLEELKNRSEMRMLFSLAKGATKEDVEAAVKIIEALRSQNDGDE